MSEGRRSTGLKTLTPHLEEENRREREIKLKGTQEESHNLDEPSGPQLSIWWFRWRWGEKRKRAEERKIRFFSSPSTLVETRETERAL